MRFKIFIVALILSLQSIYPNKINKSQSVGLVLSGGGAKGIAHIGVIQALEDNDIPIDYITGTSMGAIVGGLYAAGYTPAEMMQLIESKGFANWSTGQIDEKLTYFFFKNQPSPSLLNVTVPTRNDSIKNSSILPSSLISPIPMNFAFMELFSAYTAQCKGDFNNLFVPFRCVTSDVYHKHKIVCRSGDLGDAIRASMSFPVVFHPIEMDGVLVYDGGIYDNFPVDVMRQDFAPDIMIGSDVSAPDKKPQANDIIQQLEDMIIQNNDYSLPENEGVKLKIDLQEFSLLDFPKAPQIYKIGYDHAMAMMDSIKAKIPTRVPAEERKLRRSVFKSATPYVIFDSVTVTGGTPKQNRYFRNIFTSEHSDTFGISSAKDAYYRAITGGKLRNLIPTAEYRDNGLFRLNLKATVKDNLNIGFGGYITSSTNSMIFLSGGYNSLALNHTEAKFNTWIGQSYMAAEAIGRIFFSSGHPSSLTFDAVVSRMNYNSSVRFFYEQNPTYVTDMEAFGKLKFGIASGRNARFDLTAGYGYINYRYYPTFTDNLNFSVRNRSFYNMAQMGLEFERNTLDSHSFPLNGSLFTGKIQGMIGDYNYRPEVNKEMATTSHTPWIRAQLNYHNYLPLSNKFVFGFETNMTATTRSLPTTYDQAIVIAEEFYPTPSTHSSFNRDFRAFSYLTAGIIPVWRISSSLQLRGMFHCFMPMRKIKTDNKLTPRYGDWFADPSFFGELAAVYKFPFASLSFYGNYADAPNRQWNLGISFGVFILAPKFL